MNDYEELMQAAEPLRRYLEAYCGQYRTQKNSRNSPVGLSCGG